MDSERVPACVDGPGVALRAVADFLAIHPAGRVMARLTGSTPVELRAVLAGGGAAHELDERLAVLVAFVGAARATLALADGPSRAGLARYQGWLRAGSIPTERGPIRPIDALGDPRLAREAAADLRRTAAALLDTGGAGESLRHPSGPTGGLDAASPARVAGTPHGPRAARRHDQSPSVDPSSHRCSAAYAATSRGSGYEALSPLGFGRTHAVAPEIPSGWRPTDAPGDSNAVR
jgi:hypothetical protein